MSPAPSIQRSSPAQGQSCNEPGGHGQHVPMATPSPRAPFYADFFPLISFVATITLSASISGSQGFATAGSLFGRALSDLDTDPVTVAALKRASDAAKFFAWSTAASTVSLMITLVLQLAMTKPVFAERLSGNVRTKDGFLGLNWEIIITMAASYTALALQASSLALIGQALKVMNIASGLMSQWSLLGVGVPGLVLFGVNVNRYMKKKYGMGVAFCC